MPINSRTLAVCCRALWSLPLRRAFKETLKLMLKMKFLHITKSSVHFSRLEQQSNKSPNSSCKQFFLIHSSRWTDL